MSKEKNNRKKFLKLIIVTILVAIFTSVYFNIDRLLGKTKQESTLDESAVEIQNADLSLHFIDVGQGDSLFIELPDDTTMLIDAGIPSKGDEVCEYISALGITQIDYLVVTHGDNDHVGGIPEVLDNFEIKEIYRPYQFAVIEEKQDGKVVNEYVNPADDLKQLYTKTSKNIISNKAYNSFIEKAYTETYMENGQEKKAKVSTHYDELEILPVGDVEFKFEFFGPLQTVNAEDFIDNGDAEYTYGYPTQYYGKSDAQIKNSASCVMLLEYNEKSYLFTGDAIDTQEQTLINSLTNSEKERFTNVDLYFVGHHGSKDSSCEEFLEVIQPKMSIISVGENTYGHPTEEALTRLGEYSGDNIFRTDEHGNVIVLSNETDIQVKTNIITGTLSTKATNIDPQKEWYIYVIIITAGVFISGVIYIVQQDIKAKQRIKRYKRK